MYMTIVLLLGPGLFIDEYHNLVEGNILILKLIMDNQMVL